MCCVDGQGRRRSLWCLEQTKPWSDPVVYIGSGGQAMLVWPQYDSH